MTVKAILSRKGNAVITIKPTVPLSDAVKILDEYRIGAAVITDADQHIVGILSERDIVREERIKTLEVELKRLREAVSDA
jgi:CBS domain-containing protein